MQKTQKGIWVAHVSSEDALDIVGDMAWLGVPCRCPVQRAWREPGRGRSLDEAGACRAQGRAGAHARWMCPRGSESRLCLRLTCHFVCETRLCLFFMLLFGSTVECDSL